jgi:hypothetical protein
MPSTADSRNNSRLRSGPDRMLNVAYIRAARDQGWCPSNHPVPNDARVFVPALAGAQQVPFESSVERRINLFAGFGHFALSL